MIRCSPYLPTAFKPFHWMILLVWYGNRCRTEKAVVPPCLLTLVFPLWTWDKFQKSSCKKVFSPFKAKCVAKSVLGLTVALRSLFPLAETPLCWAAHRHTLLQHLCSKNAFKFFMCCQVSFCFRVKLISTGRDITDQYWGYLGAWAQQTVLVWVRVQKIPKLRALEWFNPEFEDLGVILGHFDPEI